MTKLNPKILESINLRCDKCNHVEPLPICDRLEPCIFFLKNSIGVKCPKCDTVMLTKKECNASIVMLKLIHNPLFIFIDKICSLFRKRKKVRMNIREH